MNSNDDTMQYLIIEELTNLIKTLDKNDKFINFKEKLNLLMYDLESLKEIRFYEIQFLEEETGLSEYEIQKYIKRYIKEKEKK